MPVTGEVCQQCKDDTDAYLARARAKDEKRMAREQRRRDEAQARWDALNPKQQQAERDRLAAAAAARVVEDAAREARRLARKQAGIARGVATRAQRRELEINRIAKEYAAGRRYGPRQDCVMCRTPLGDPASIERGVGSECWQHLLKRVEEIERQGRA
jgi:hypothetical protein